MVYAWVGMRELAQPSIDTWISGIGYDGCDRVGYERVSNELLLVLLVREGCVLL